MANASDIMAESITKQLLEMMGDGSDKAMKLWRTKLASFTASGLPYNADNGNVYNGGNVIQLMLIRMERGFESNGWITYGNMQKRGYSIKKGCKNPWAWVLSPRMAFTKKDKAGNVITDSNGDPQKSMGPQRAYKVFNMDCVELNGKELPGKRNSIIDASNDEADGEVIAPTYTALDNIIEHHGIEIHYGGNQAFYRPKADTVHLPEHEAFTSEQAFYHVAAHEFIHWTGGAKRLDRDQKGGFGSPDYAFEELIAELGAAFTMAELGMGDSQMPAHANYLKSWIKALKDDKTFVMKAASKASQAMRYLTQIEEAAASAPDDATSEPDVPAATIPSFPKRHAA